MICLSNKYLDASKPNSSFGWLNDISHAKIPPSKPTTKERKLPFLHLERMRMPTKSWISLAKMISVKTNEETDFASGDTAPNGTKMCVDTTTMHHFCL